MICIIVPIRWSPSDPLDNKVFCWIITKWLMNSFGADIFACIVRCKTRFVTRVIYTNCSARVLTTIAKINLGRVCKPCALPHGSYIIHSLCLLFLVVFGQVCRFTLIFNHFYLSLRVFWTNICKVFLPILVNLVDFGQFGQFFIF